jgi:endoglucanase
MRALVATWASYRQVFIVGGGRVIDPERKGATTSEGQAYALLRAVWMDDRTTFDQAWNWTHAHLWLPSSQRFGYLWGSEGSSALSSTDSATDADQDIALALIFAGRRWKNSSYRNDALEVLRGIWVNEVATLDGIPYALAGNWAKQSAGAGAVINPSYLAPYAYRIFATVDSAHPWMSLVTSSYAALSACSQAPLRAGKSVGLPPNWCVISRSSGQASYFSAASDGDNYGYDAFRVMWRVALDLRWFHSPSALAYLQQQGFLRQQWMQHNSLASVYGHDGSVQVNYGDPAIYAGDIGAFSATDPGAVKAILEQQLTSSYHAGSPAHFGDAKNYYEQNWVWFGIAFAAGALPNLAG